MQRRIAIIAYDITSNRIRRKVHKILLEWRLDGQKSVHECPLYPAEARELFIQLGQTIDRRTDRLLLAWLAPQRQPRALGIGRVDALAAGVGMLREVKA
jgi:CRISPR-associated protein Cas2